MPDAEVIVQPDQTSAARQVEHHLDVIVDKDLLDSTLIGRGYGGLYEYGNY